MTTPFFNTDEFAKRLTPILGSEERAEEAVRLHNQYSFVLGLFDKDLWEEFFEHRAAIWAFRNKHNVGHTAITPTWDPADFERILVSELAISPETAAQVSECEWEYGVELGIC